MRDTSRTTPRHGTRYCSLWPSMGGAESSDATTTIAVGPLRTVPMAQAAADALSTHDTARGVPDFAISGLSEHHSHTA